MKMRGLADAGFVRGVRALGMVGALGIACPLPAMAGADFTDLHPLAPQFARTVGQGAYNGTTVGYGFLPGPVRNGRAIAWDPSGTSRVLEPAPGLYDSYAFNVWGTTAVGVGRELSGFGIPLDHAHLWDVETGVATDLHPLMTGVDQSLGQDVWNNRVAIYAFGPATGGAEHAFLYDGSTFTNLHEQLPAGQYSRTYRVRVHGDLVTAWTDGPATQGVTQSIVWDLSGAAPPRSLIYDGADSVQAEDVHGSRIVGSSFGAITGQTQHATLWTVTPGSISALDLHPAGWLFSSAMSIWGDLVVGVGLPPGASSMRAVVWNLATHEVADLAQLTLTGDLNSSAFGIDGLGTIVGARGDPLEWRAARWTNIPAPGAAAIFAIVGLGAAAQPRRR